MAIVSDGYQRLRFVLKSDAIIIVLRFIVAS